MLNSKYSAAASALSVILIFLPSFVFCAYGIGLYGFFSSLIPAHLSLTSKSLSMIWCMYSLRSARLIVLICLASSLRFVAFDDRVGDHLVLEPGAISYNYLAHVRGAIA